MFKWLTDWWWGQKFAFHAETCKLRDKMGRLYVFRDRPDWFVEAAAGLLERARTEQPESVQLLQQAADEWALRQRRAAGAGEVPHG
jgi:hypothetical protein